MAVLLNGTNGLIQAYDYQTPTTGYSYVFAAGTQVLVMNPAGTLAAVTITMPASPSDGMTITFSSTKQITALTLNGNTGQTIVGGVNSLAPYQVVSFIYRSASTTWFPMATQVAQATGPAFSAYVGTNQSIANNTYTKVSVNTEEFDTNSNYDAVTNYRFTPTVAGYYQVNALIGLNGGWSSVLLMVYKNGSRFKDGTAPNAVSMFQVNVAALVYLNGTTDYIELYVVQFTGSTQTVVGGNIYNSYFQAALVRTA